MPQWNIKRNLVNYNKTKKSSKDEQLNRRRHMDVMRFGLYEIFEATARTSNIVSGNAAVNNLLVKYTKGFDLKREYWFR